MSALVKTIKSRLTDDTIYPVTKADAVYMGSSTVSTVEGQINSINNIIGSETMGTTATTITGAIAQHEQEINPLNSRLDYQTGSKTVNTSTFTTICSKTLPEGGGVFLIIGDLMFDTNTTGTRILVLEVDETTTNNVNNSVLGSGRADLSKTRILDNTNGTYSNVYLRAYQNSGGNITVTGRITVIRLK